MEDPEKVYIPVITAVFLLLLTWKTLGNRAFSSNLFMISIYAMLVPILFFTYGSYIEKLVVEKQIQKVVDQIKEVPERVGFPLPNVSIPEPDESDDDYVKDKNEQLVSTAFIVLTCGFLGGVFLSYLLWVYAVDNFSWKRIIYANLGLLLLITIVEIAFFGVVTLNYRVLDTNSLIKNSLDKIADKIEGLED